MRLSPLLFRRIHKWIGLILGLQFLLWTVSGTMMAILDQETVAGGPAAAAAPPALPARAEAWPALSRSLAGTAITGLAVRPLLDRHVIEVTSSGGIRLYDARTGAPVDVDAALARAVAERAYPGEAPVRGVTLVTERTLAIRDHGPPAWRVDFADDANSSFYVSRERGTLLVRRNDTWRLWDFFWMLHNMDYADRTDFNHPLIIVLGFGAVWLALTGFYLLFKTAWRPDFRWLRRRRARPAPPAAAVTRD